MAASRRYPLVLRALAKIQDGANPPGLNGLVRTGAGGPRGMAELDHVLARIGPLPREALFLGEASDGLPVLLNLHDFNAGPVLIIGDPGSGKTRFLRQIAQTLTRTHDSREVQFGVITSRPEDWADLEDSEHNVDVFQAHDSQTRQFILSLAAWAHENMQDRQSVLMLVDDLESVAGLDPETVQHFRWLLLRGPARRVWPIVTLHAARYGQVIGWLPSFRARIFGRIADRQVASAVGAGEEAALADLEAGLQFSLPESGKWLQFRLPSF